ncbi:MAG TPA: hypothetical protein VI320_21275 [Terracidiphilus sp.]|jgi:hypothetical protein
MFSASLLAFNLLNYLNFKLPSGSLSSGTFSKVTATHAPSGIFSGVDGDESPRIVQFKTKIVLQSDRQTAREKAAYSGLFAS